MRRSFLLAATALFCAALGLRALPAAAAQPATTLAISNRTLQVDGLLRHGQELEVQRRWGEALAHYEEALRAFPEETTLERRFELARVHYDLGRRYADRSFCEKVSRLPTQQALDLYLQVLLKIQSHYVELPAWRELVDRGTADLEVALEERAFLEQNLPSRDLSAVAAFRRELHDALSQREPATRIDARDSVVVAAELARSRLGIPPTAVVMEYLCGATNSLDPYSAYLTPDQLSEVYSQIEGNFVGLGIELKAQAGTLVIVRVITGSPAERSGIRPGDRIVAVNGRLTQDITTDQAANQLQGVEGSEVTLTVAAPEQPPRELVIRRQRVEVPSVDQVRLLDPQQGIAYLRLTCFQRTTRRDLETALWRLHREGMRSLIVDVRGNPGGLLVTAVEVVNLFLDRGVIVSTRGRSPQEDFTYTAHEQGVWRVPLTVVIDQDSASAAEIFAGAIRDHRRGTTVGVRSFGKGSVQGIFPLQDSDSGLRLTTAKFYSPNGHPYSRTGVEPDVLVHQAARPIHGAVAPRDDAILTAALTVARESLGASIAKPSAGDLAR
ncbi:MAG: S41 family peptidase [Thermoguttaceae bacterium]|jgi:carboxyl-terminal processing protease